jgi:hypothetical protein
MILQLQLVTVASVLPSDVSVRSTLRKFMTQGTDTPISRGRRHHSCGLAAIAIVMSVGLVLGGLGLHSSSAQREPSRRGRAGHQSSVRLARPAQRNSSCPSDAVHDDLRFVIEVEAGRVTRGNAVYCDLIRSVQYLSREVRER